MQTSYSTGDAVRVRGRFARLHLAPNVFPIRGVVEEVLADGSCVVRLENGNPLTCAPDNMTPAAHGLTLAELAPNLPACGPGASVRS